MNILRSVLTLILSFILFLVSVVSLGQELMADELLKLETIAKYITSDFDKTGDILKEFGYSPPDFISEQSWKQYPAIKKLEFAYKAAKNAGSNPRNAQQMLAMLAKRLAADYESVYYEKVLSQYKNYDLNTVDKLKFRNLKNEVKFSEMTIGLTEKSILFRISKYSESSLLGGPRGILSNYFNIAENRAYEILSSSESNY